MTQGVIKTFHDVLQKEFKMSLLQPLRKTLLPCIYANNT